MGVGHSHMYRNNCLFMVVVLKVGPSGPQMVTSHSLLLEAPIPKPRILGMFEWLGVVVISVY